MAMIYLRNEFWVWNAVCQKKWIVPRVKQMVRVGEGEHGCRGIVTADVLAKGLSRRAIATRKLKGVNRDKGHERVLY